MCIPQPLATQVAGIAANLHATAEHRAAQAGVIAALHALILAALARLFTRLEDLVTLWQSGQLPASTPCLRHRPSQPSAAPAAIKQRATNRASPDASPNPHVPNPTRVRTPVRPPIPFTAPRIIVRADPQPPSRTTPWPRAGPLAPFNA